MVKIALCDDVPQAREELKQMLKCCCKDVNKEVEFYEFENGAELLTKLQPFDVLYLDIEMPLMDGFEVAKEILKTYPKMKVIMATGLESRFREAFEISAYYFLTKPFDKAEVERVLLRLLKDLDYKKYLDVVDNRRKVTLLQGDIVSISSRYGGVEVQTKEGRYQHYETLKKLKCKLSENFVIINKGLMINLEHIKKLNGDSVLLSSGEECEVSRRNKKELMELHNQYLKNK